MATINFIWELPVNQFNDPKNIKKWLLLVAKNEKFHIEGLNYYFVSGDKILEINKKFLNHNYYTDIITFDHSFLNRIKGEIYICIPVIKENSEYFSEGRFIDELNRNIVHGLLHLLGYNDLSDEEMIIMRKKEDYYLEEFKKFISTNRRNEL